MTTKFRRRVGAAADVKELEYLSALHQTGMPGVREDGTVSSLDVVRFLKSREGLNVPKEHGIRIVKGLGGGAVSDDVIQQILQQPQESLLERQEQQEKRNIMDKIRLAQSLGSLRKRLMHKNTQEVGANDESLLVDAAVDEEEQVPPRASGSMDDVSSAKHLGSQKSEASSQHEVDSSDQSLTGTDVENPSSETNAECEVYLDILQIMAILLIPTLARAGKEWHDAQLSPDEEEEQELPPEEEEEQELPPDEEEEEEQEPSPSPTYDGGIKGNILKLYDTYKEKLKEKEDASHESLRPKPEGLIPDAHSTMLKMIQKVDSSPPVMDASLVRKLLIMHGECERAADPVMIDKMLEAASSSSGLFDEEALVNALTSDLSSWKVGAEDSNTTSFYDVWGYSNYYEKAVLEVEKEEAEKAAKEAAESGDEEEGNIGENESDTKEPAKSDDEEADKSNTASENESNQKEEYSSKTSRLAKLHEQESFHSATSVPDDVEKPTGAALNALTGAGAEGVNLAKQAGAGGVVLVKQAGTGGVNVVKGVQASGVTKLKAEKKLIAMDKDRFEMDLAAKKGDRHLSSQKSGTTEDDSKYKMDRPRSLIAIDSATDAYSSSLLMVGTFIFFICTSLVYAILFQQMTIFDPNCGEKFSCLLVDKIITWAIFACFLSLCGYFVIIPLSTGNNPVERSPFLNVIAVVIAIFLTWVPYAAVNLYQERRVKEPYDKPEKTVRAPDYDNSQLITVIIGCIVAGLIFVQFLLAVIGNRRIRQRNWTKALLTSVARGGGRSKRAATRKINGILLNACSMKPKKSTSRQSSDLDISEELMINFVIRGEKFEDCGGLIWTWKRLFSEDLFEEDGVWIMSRLLVIQMIQALFIGFKTYALTLFVEEAVRRCQEWQDNLQPDLPQWVYDFVPSPREARIALWPAFSVAVFVMFTIFFVYLPSYVRRVIQFRCGMIPSLHSDIFPEYRRSVDLVYTNIGNALYAMFGAALLFFFLVGLVLFLFIWPATKDFMILLLAWGLGLSITICIKYLIQTIWRFRFYAGLYRTNPRRANLTQLALECWYIGLGGGVLVARLCEFLLAACFFVGRTDVPFLSADVSMFGYIFDYAPQSFVKDILVHEAHRHPYFERLVSMYMMKLKDDSFCTDAGACWRQLFVATLMPWLVRLRMFSDERLGDIMEEYNTRRREGQSPLQISQKAAIKQDYAPSRTDTATLDDEVSSGHAMSQVEIDSESVNDQLPVGSQVKDVKSLFDSRSGSEGEMDPTCSVGLWQRKSSKSGSLKRKSSKSGSLKLKSSASNSLRRKSSKSDEADSTCVVN